MINESNPKHPNVPAATGKELVCNTVKTWSQPSPQIPQAKCCKQNLSVNRFIPPVERGGVAHSEPLSLLPALTKINASIEISYHIFFRCRNEKLFLTWNFVAWEVEGLVGVDSNVVVAGAVQLRSQVLGHHVGAGRKARAVREGGHAGNHGQGCACPDNSGSGGSPAVLHPVVESNEQVYFKAAASSACEPAWRFGLAELQSCPSHSL